RRRALWTSGAARTAAHRMWRRRNACAWRRIFFPWRFILPCPALWATVPLDPMNLVARQDRVLLGGLAVALIVVFAQPIRYLLDLARDVENSSGLALVPALIILTVVFVFHQQGKRQEAKARAAAAEADALRAGARASEMEAAVAF